MNFLNTMKPIALAVFLLFISVSVIPSTGTTDVKQITMPTSSGNTLYVGGDGPGNYSKIQDAIDNASDGDTVFVYSGTYIEELLINKTIDLIGEDSESTFIESPAIAPVVWVKADGVLIKQFTIKADIQCICISSSRDNKISNNILTRYESKLNRDWMLPDDGIDLVDSLNNTITNNTIVNRTLGIGFQNSSSNVVSMNTITNCVACVHLEWFSNYNTIYENEFIDNHYFGILISEESNNNYIYHNNFINCNQNALDECINTWDNDYPSGGNYWDDYTGEDNDGDGIGDTPYHIPGGDNEDRYPLTEPISQTELEIGFISGGLFRIKAEINNIGRYNATEVNWTIKIIGKLIPIFYHISGEIPIIKPGESETITTGFLLGLGRYKITVVAEASNAPKVSKTINGFIILFFIIIR